MSSEGCQDPVVLSYHDALVRRSDRHLLTGPHWLNDTLVHFYWEYLQRELFADRADVLFVAPNLTQLVRMTAHEHAMLSSLLVDLQLASRQLILLPLNDCQSLDSPGGSHWSLLVFQRSGAGGCFWHFDSMPGSNRVVACELAEGLSGVIQPAHGAQSAPVEVECAVQTNGYDCGVFVLCHARRVAERHVRGDKLDGVAVTQAEVNYLRRRLLQLIDELAKE